jgi:hypothetical protein
LEPVQENAPIFNGWRAPPLRGKASGR